MMQQQAVLIYYRLRNKHNAPKTRVSAHATRALMFDTHGKVLMSPIQLLLLRDHFESRLDGHVGIKVIVLTRNKLAQILSHWRAAASSS